MVFAMSINKFFSQFSKPTLIVGGLWILILILGITQDIPLTTLLSDAIRRFGMWGILVLAMVPSIQSGSGPNFALPVGICAGLLAMFCSIYLGFTGMNWLLASAGMAIVFALLAGYLYGRLMNAVKGSEMIISTCTGFAVTFLFCIVWMVLPFYSQGWGSFIMGSGLRQTVSLNYVGGAQILNDFLSFRLFGDGFIFSAYPEAVGGIFIPTGMLLVVAFFLFSCVVVFSRKVKNRDFCDWYEPVVRQGIRLKCRQKQSSL